jgi:D-glycero-beta-D-manno-heptose-7-phosphate kinase
VNAIDFSRVQILTVGDVMLDRYWFGDVQRISPEAPVPVVRVKRTDERLGGAANVARNVAELGAKITLIGVIGDDEPGQRLQQMSEALGVQTLLTRDPSVPTTIKLRIIGRQQQLLRVDFEQPPESYVLAQKLEVFGAQLHQHDVIILSDYGKGGLAQVEPLIQLACAAGKTVIADPKGDDYERYRGVTVLTPNRAELREVVGSWKDEADLETRAQKLRRSLAVRYLLLTRSEEGMSLFSDEATLHVATQAREVYDVSGAGDTVVAVLACALAAGQPIATAVRLANRAAGIVVGKLGTAAVSPAELFDGQCVQTGSRSLMCC